ncbi:MAG: hypothetical protein HYU85_05450 [Chloroflexi bacterium]|nr:hypothetical protein [Chloroflexota bacterium]
MNHTLFLKIALPSIAIPALVVLFLPAGVWATYVDMVEPLSLLIGSFLALYVSFSYRKQLKTAFIFLSVFLLIYALAIVLFLSFSPILVPYLEPLLGEVEMFRLVQSVQFINYAMLFFFCINLLKVVDITQLNNNGWILFTLTVIFSIFLATYPVWDLIKAISNLGLAGISHLVIRIFDAALIIVLVPVLWLYVQYLKSQHKQSLTFTIIIFGIIFFTLFDYLFELIITIFPRLLAEGSHLYAAIPEMLFIYGYLIIAVGLYAHRKQDEWGYNAIDRAMAGELKLVDVG